MLVGRFFGMRGWYHCLGYCLDIHIDFSLESADFWSLRQLQDKTILYKRTLNYQFIFCVNIVKRWVNGRKYILLWFQVAWCVGLWFWLLVNCDAGQRCLQPAGIGCSLCIQQSACIPPVCRLHTVFENTQMGIHMGPRAPGNGLKNETWVTDSAVVFNENAWGRCREKCVSSLVWLSLRLRLGLTFQIFGPWEGPHLTLLQSTAYLGVFKGKMIRVGGICWLFAALLGITRRKGREGCLMRWHQCQVLPGGRVSVCTCEWVCAQLVSSAAQVSSGRGGGEERVT